MTSHEGAPRSGTGRDEVARTALSPGFGDVAAAGPAALVVDNDYGSKLALTALL
jgi:hypothetical protein